MNKGSNRVSIMNTIKSALTPRRMAIAGVIAGIYVALTMLLHPLSFGSLGGWELRVSEAMTLLPMLTPAAIPGLFIGCIISNALGSTMLDVIVGSLASLIAACATYALRGKSPFIAALPPVIVNALLVGWVVSTLYGLPLWFAIFSVGLGQAVACYVLGIPLYYALKKILRPENL